MEISGRNFKYILGIGAFLILSLIEFVGFLEYFIKDLLIVYEFNPKLILLIPELINLISFIIISYILIKKFKIKGELENKRLLIILIASFFVILIVQFLYTYFITDFLMIKYLSSYSLFVEGRQANLEILSYLSFTPILEFIIFATLLFTVKRVE